MIFKWKNNLYLIVFYLDFGVPFSFWNSIMNAYYFLFIFHRQSPTFKSIEEKVGSAYTSVKVTTPSATSQ